MLVITSDSGLALCLGVVYYLENELADPVCCTGNLDYLSAG